ncbi:50S ribosomal protein L20 [Candidatus Nomurabacteria bacterium RIFCSPLOWO2_01_FULL_40_15]|uniref:Large ribosomal subunit protein bL20 n=1 Tax=Candidatus Nomurabacteria bacterium RIFCSPLOWO2_01_FULL_40_15 TaxID=1801772 RepID=A0A1F6X8J9_9BACT|nr:MAG: 50S ribosomal protein L20 [Candidatus Nomurabacteria bacterium RIFCSPLOWO2_01_FULL_40_15]
MTRVKKGVHALKRRRSVLKQTKGMRHARSTKERQAKEALLHAGSYAFAHRRDKKSHNRKLWNIKINAGSRLHGISYSKLIDALKKKKILLDRKILSDFAENHPLTFAKVLASAVEGPKQSPKHLTK